MGQLLSPPGLTLSRPRSRDGLAGVAMAAPEFLSSLLFTALYTVATVAASVVLGLRRSPAHDWARSPPLSGGAQPSPGPRPSKQ